MLSKLNLGPAALVTAAFIGPGTIITASHAGANFGFTLIWALLFAVLAAIVLQEMSARLGLATGMGLAENLERRFERKIPKRAVQIIVLLAIVVGNAAYQGGNIAGANIGLTIISENLFASSSGSLQVFTISLIAGSLLWFGGYPMVEKTLLALVALMSLCFVAVAWLVVEDWSVVAAALLTPQLPDGAGLSVIALIGTTVVPYNLFLHSRSTQLNAGLGGVEGRALIAGDRIKLFAPSAQVQQSQIAPLKFASHLRLRILHGQEKER